jgi:hypothetical protein
MMKYSTANIRMSGKKLMMLDWAPSAPPPNAFEMKSTSVSPL